MSASAFRGMASSDDVDGSFGGDDLIGFPDEGEDVPSFGWCCAHLGCACDL
jgi:hypothetical protein